MTRIQETFAVLGLSEFGFRTATGLFSRGAAVIAIDRNEPVVQRAASLTTKAVCADAMDFEVMEHLGVFDVDTVVIGLRKAFEATVLLAHHLNSTTSVRRVIAQVDSEPKAEALRRLGVDEVILPERDSADRLVRQLALPDLLDRIPLTPTTAIFELRSPDVFVGRSIQDLAIRKKHGVYVVGIHRASAGGDATETLIAPPPDTAFQAGDTLLVLGPSAALERFAAATRSPRPADPLIS